jgi:hypothetical protein
MVQLFDNNPEDGLRPTGRIKRPWAVTFLALTVLTLAGMFLISAWDAASLWLNPLHALVRISPAYLVGRGLVWGGVGVIAFIGLWRGLRWAPRLVRWGTVAFVLFYWLERLLLVQVDAWGANGWFSAGMSILAIFLVWWILSLKPSRAFFGEKRE